MTKAGGDSLWDMCLAHSKAKEKEDPRSDEASVLVVGSKNSGKTSIILRFLDREEQAKPTTALEYTFGRRAKGHNIAKDVAHIWELGGGTWLSKLVDVPINSTNLMSLSVVIVLDLSLPNELWFTLETLLKSLKGTIDHAIREAQNKDPEIREKLKKRAMERIGLENPDADMMDPSLIPLVIIGGKYDAFQEFDPEKRKVICKTLRFIAHINGATLQFFSIKQDTLMNKARTLMTHLAFGTTASKSVQTDHNKPLFVPAGLDAIQQIGSPPIPEGDLGRLNVKNPTELWKHAYTSFFPQESISNPATVEDPAKDAQYAENSVDSMRSQKDEELERYRKLCERRAKEAAQNAYNDGF